MQLIFAISKVRYEIKPGIPEEGYSVEMKINSTSNYCINLLQ
jgi:hypothetical protein